MQVEWTHGTEEDDFRVAWREQTASRGEPDLLAIDRRKLEPYLVDLDRLRTRQREGLETRTRTQGSKLLMMSDTFTPSSSAAVVPRPLASRIEKVGKAMAAKSGGVSSDSAKCRRTLQQ